jgi:transcriptional regulator with XRE-family HTH domain
MERAPHAFSLMAADAAQLLGARIQLARRERRWTLQELAERVGVTRVTMRKVERGDPSVRLGIAFEAAAVTSVPLFHEDLARVRLERGRVDDRLAVLPQIVRRRVIDDDF